MKALVRGFERRIGQLYEDLCCLPEDNINVAVVLDACCHVHTPTALNWSKQISVLRFISVDMLMVIEAKVLFEDSTISMLNLSIYSSLGLVSFTGFGRSPKCQKCIQADEESIIRN